MRLPPAPVLLLALAVAAPAATAQSNVVPGLDVRLSDLDGLAAFGRIGQHPSGRNGLAALVTVCNQGTAVVDWFAPMAADHPVYAFLLCRLHDGRFVQVSDRSFVKHGFGSLNDPCGTCVLPPLGPQQLGLGCSDTYAAVHNSDRFWLGPPGEIDPWLVQWQPRGSHFDRGEPSVGLPQSHDGVRSLDAAMVAAMDGVKHRIEVDDQDLAVPGATFFLAGRVLVRGEAEALRADDQLSRRFAASWNGSQWVFANPGPLVAGTPLQHWPGAVLRSATNGADDGRVWIGATATPLADGRWHYEYALHNRDNGRGIAGVRIPKCPTARVLAAGVRDADRSPFNDWTVAVTPGEIAVLAPAGNALEWNTIHNVWFDCDAGPAGGTVTLDEARPGPGALQFPVLDVPSPLRLSNEYLGDGCGAPAPRLRAAGTPPVAAIPNASFSLLANGRPGSTMLLFASLMPGRLQVGPGCLQYVTGIVVGLGVGFTSPAGELRHAVPIPNDPSLEGLDLIAQAAEVRAGGALFGMFDLSNGLRLRAGNQRTGCP